MGLVESCGGGRDKRPPPKEWPRANELTLAL